MCDSVCLHLFSYARPRWSKATVWPRREAELVRRAGCALIASLAIHDKDASDRELVACVAPLEAIAIDERAMVKKGVSWALRQIGKRNGALNLAAIGAAERLAAHERAPARWIGRDVLRELRSDTVQTRLARRAATAG